MGLAVNVAYVEPVHQVQYESRVPIEQFGHLGLRGYLLDMIDGPAPILNYLCRLYNIHNIAVGDDRTYEMASQIPAEIRLFFSSECF